jgi:uncharacterized protein YjeT (DUF2065 family)
MFTSLYFGRFFGLYLLIMGILLITRSNHMRAVVHEFIKSPALITFAGSLSLILGLLIVLLHNTWEWSWRVIVTLLAYLTIIQGLIRLFHPEFLKKIAHHLDKVQILRVIGLVMAVIGVFLLICTFFDTMPLYS